MSEHIRQIARIYDEIVRLDKLRDIDVTSLRQAQGRIQGFDQRIETLVETAIELERRQRATTAEDSVQAVA